MIVTLGGSETAADTHYLFPCIVMIRIYKLHIEIFFLLDLWV